MKLIKLLSIGFLMLMPVSAMADISLISSTSNGGEVSYSTTITALIAVASMALAPFAILIMTPFLRISIVLSLMRKAIGTNTAPSNKVIAAISLVVTFFIMQPHIDAINHDYYQAYKSGEIGEEALIDGSWSVLREFMLNNTRESSMEAILSISDYDIDEREDLPASVVISSYIISELTVAFFIAFMCFIPFLIIDLLTGIILMSLGMMMVSPMIISLPLKIGFFVVLDGWTILVSNLAGSFVI